jgi:hypothetical protein
MSPGACADTTPSAEDEAISPSRVLERLAHEGQVPSRDAPGLSFTCLKEIVRAKQITSRFSLSVGVRADMRTERARTRAAVLLAAYLRTTRTSPTVFGAGTGVCAQTVWAWTHGRGLPRVSLWNVIETVTGGAVPAMAWTIPEGPRP